MPRKAIFTEADVRRALRPALALGLPVSRFEIGPDGQITVHTGEAPDVTAIANDWDAPDASA